MKKWEMRKWEMRKWEMRKWENEETNDNMIPDHRESRVPVVRELEYVPACDGF